MKRIKKITLAVMGVIAMGVGTNALANVALPYGWYIEGNIGDTKTVNPTYARGSNINTWSVTWNLIGGYKFMPYFAAEMGYFKYGHLKVRDGNNIVAATDNRYAFDFAGVGLLPVGNTGAEVFAKLGMAYIRSQVSASNAGLANPAAATTGSHNTTRMFYGIGGDYSITSNFPISIQWQRAQGDDWTGKLDTYSIGLGYLFG